MALWFVIDGLARNITDTLLVLVEIGIEDNTRDGLALDSGVSLAQVSSFSRLPCGCACEGLVDYLRYLFGSSVIFCGLSFVWSEELLALAAENVWTYS